jgi:hypothetical protein
MVLGKNQGKQMSIRIELSPFDIILKAFDKLYPDKDAIIVFSNGLYEDQGGYTYLSYSKEDNEESLPPIIFIDCVVPLALAITMIEHQLAHVVLGQESADDTCTGTEDSHSEEFNEIFRNIRVECLRMMGEGMKNSKIFKPRNIDYSTMN